MLFFFRFFRVITAESYLLEFASDRRHMRRPDGTWIKPPPPYAPIATSCKFFVYNFITLLTMSFSWIFYIL